jgi:hypothetical protein
MYHLHQQYRLQLLLSKTMKKMKQQQSELSLEGTSL